MQRSGSKIYTTRPLSAIRVRRPVRPSAHETGGLGDLGLVLAAVLALPVIPSLAAGQDTVRVGEPTAVATAEELPRAVAEEVVAFYNRETTIRLSGRTLIPADREVEGDVAVLGGPVELGGRIGGNLVIINGDINLRPGAWIEGRLTVVGGAAKGVEGARIGRGIATYDGILRYRRTDDGIAYLGTRPGPRRPSATRLRLPDWTIGDSEIYVSARAYNRVEGLPIAIGPRITTGGGNPLRFEALLVYRSEAGFDLDEKDIGYEVGARQYLGGHRDVWIEAGLHSVIDPIERWQLTNLENSLSFFLLRSDYRDYYERTGWAVSLGGRLGRALRGALEYIDEDHETVQTRSPWTILFNTGDPFDPNARINDGDLRSLALRLSLDTRNDPDAPGSGWYNQLRLEQALGGRLAEREPDFTHFFLDLRRYNRVSPGAVLALRFTTGGRAGGSFMPAQREHVIGGIGSLPGYDQRRFDCGVRSQVLIGEVAGYGCQRFALFQAEYRGDLNFDLHWGDDDRDGEITDIFSVDFEPDLILFYNAGAAWNTGEGFIDHLTNSNNWVADVGAGLELGGFGVYLAYPLAGSGGFNFFARLSGRF